MEPRRSTRLRFRETLKRSNKVLTLYSSPQRCDIQFAETFLPEHQELQSLQNPDFLATFAHVGPIGSYPAKLGSSAFKDWYLGLCKNNMKALYEAVWGWSDHESDLQYEKEGSHFFFAFLGGDIHQPIGVCQIIVEWYYDRAVLYVYEIQVERKHHGQGIGRHFMKMLETMGRDLSLDAIVLTCIKQNKRAMNFYSKVGFLIDESSPDETEKAKYEIMSKKITPL